MAEKSLIKDFLNFLFNGNKPSESKDISANDAIILQKKYIENFDKLKDSSCTPPYFEIAKQLNSDKSEIFRAAVYYLVEIAENESSYKAAITSILQECKKAKKCAAEDLDYLEFNLNKLSH